MRPRVFVPRHWLCQLPRRCYPNGRSWRRTHRIAEELTDYLRDIGINVRYLHNEIDAIERVEILCSLRKGEFDVFVVASLLREGLDLPGVSLVAILDADKGGPPL